MARERERPSGLDSPRFLNRRLVPAYTERLDLAVLGEPEAVSESEQKAITVESRRRDRARRLAQWRDCACLIEAAVGGYEPLADPATKRDLRALLHFAKRIDARLSAAQ
jgi:hypothetical protein